MLMNTLISPPIPPIVPIRNALTFSELTVRYSFRPLSSMIRLITNPIAPISPSAAVLFSFVSG